MDNGIYQLAINAIRSWQMATIVGLILLDVGFGIAAALRNNVFRWREVAAYYRTDVLPYILGYVVLYVAIRLIIPESALEGWGGELSGGAVIMAWGTLMGSLVSSVLRNMRDLYRPKQETPVS